MSGVFRGGVPLYPDVRRLLDYYGTPAEGLMIPYDEIAVIVTAPVASSRWRSVVAAWRRALMRPPHVRRLAAHADARVYRVLPGGDHVRQSARDVRLAVRRVKRQVVSVAWIESSRLDEVSRAERDHLLLIGGSITLAHDQAQRQLSVVMALPAPVRGAKA